MVRNRIVSQDPGRSIMSDKAILTVGDQRIELPILTGTRGRTGDRHHQAPRPDGLDHLRPFAGKHQRLPQRDHLHRRRKRHPPLPRHPHRTVHRQAELRRGGLDADFRPAAAARRTDPLQRSVDGQRTAARRREAPVPAHPARRPADGHPLGHVEQPGLLPPGVLGPGGRRLAGGSRRAADQQGPHDRRVSPIAARSGCRSTIPTRTSAIAPISCT